MTMQEDSTPWWNYAIFILPLLLGVWVLSHYPAVIHKTPEQIYILSFSLASWIKMASIFYGLYVLPGLFLISLGARGQFSGRFFSSQRVLLAFTIGCTAHIIAIFLQKYLHLPYHPFVVLSCLALAYLILALALSRVKDRSLLREVDFEQEATWVRWLAVLILLLGLFLGLEMTLRGRASSLSLVGDGYPHLINTLGTLEDGPMPDGLPFYSTFILNIHPMAFHALLVNLKVLTPGLKYMDLLRYFSVLMVPLFLACMMGLFSFLGRNSAVGALSALAALFVSGGGLSLKVPIVFFPWYWSLAWCLSAAVFFILLKDGLKSHSLALCAGVVFGVGVLVHPFFAFRMGTIMVFFLPLEILRRLWVKENLGSLLPRAALFALGAAVPVGLWLGPLLLKHRWEATYPYAYIVENFKSVAPAGVEYIQKFREVKFDLKSLYLWSRENAGLFPCIFAPFGIVAAFRRPQEPASAMLLAWLFAMAALVLLPFLPNPYRYFEYFFFALVALSAYGGGFLLSLVPKRWHVIFLAGLLMMVLWSVWLDFFPKYHYALNIYGRTSLSPADIAEAEGRAYDYLQKKRAGRLDESYGGNYTGYLWSRQKKIWDIYIRSQTLKNPPK
jgi:hypothetical protein